MKHQLWLRPATLFVAIVALVLVGFAANTHTASAQVGAGCPKGSSWQWIDNVMWCVPSGVAVQPPVEAYYPRPNCYGLTNASCPVNDLDTNKISPDKSRQMTYVGKDTTVSIWGDTGGRYRSTGVDVDGVPFDGWIKSSCLTTYGDCSKTGTLWSGNTYRSQQPAYPGYDYSSAGIGGHQTTTTPSSAATGVSCPPGSTYVNGRGCMTSAYWGR